MLQTIAERGAPAVADEMIPRLLGTTTRRMRPEIVAFVNELVVANSPEAIAGAVTALMTRPDSTPLLSAIACPALIAVGDEDEVTPPDVARGMQRAIRQSDLAVIGGAGHLSNLEQPSAFNHALAAFLDRL